MEKYIQSAYEFYRQSTPTGYMSYEEFKKSLAASCAPCNCKKTPWWLLLAGGAAIGYSLKK